MTSKFGKEKKKNNRNQQRVNFMIQMEDESDNDLAHTLFHNGTGEAGKAFTRELGIQLSRVDGKNQQLHFLGNEGIKPLVEKCFTMLSHMQLTGTIIDKNTVGDLVSVFVKKENSEKVIAFNAVAAEQRPVDIDRPANDRTTKKQKELDSFIKGHDLTFAYGPAGTGKTYSGVKNALDDLKAQRVKRIVIARPMMGAGEEIGFLPGDMMEKANPWLRPILDEFDKVFGVDAWKEMIEKGRTLEICPIAFMRGRTFDDAFILIDEAQNCDIEQTKMYLTRIGQNSKMVVTGDPGQVDLPATRPSGLGPTVEVLKNNRSVGMMEFTDADVVRSKIVKDILGDLKKLDAIKIELEDAAYEKKNAQNQKGSHKKATVASPGG